MPPSVADAAAPQIGERPVALRVGAADAQDLAESCSTGIVVRQRRAVGGRVFDAVEAEVRVAPGDRLGDGRKGDVDESRRASETARQQIGDLDLEADDAIGAGRIGLDIRRAAFGVSGPDQFRRRLGGDVGNRCRHEQREQHQADAACRADRGSRGMFCLFTSGGAFEPPASPLET